MRFRITLLYLCWTMIVSPSISARAEDNAAAKLIDKATPTTEPSRLSSNQLIEGVRKYYEDLKAVNVEYEMFQESAKDIRDAEVAPQPELTPETRRQFAMKGEKRLVQTTEQGEVIYNLPSGPERRTKEMKRIWTYDGENSRSLEPDEKIAAIRSGKQGGTDMDFYMNALYVPTSDSDIGETANTAFYLPYALDKTSGISEGTGPFWSVRGKLETVDGAACHVLESRDGDRLWIDPEIGFAIRLRKLPFRLSKIPRAEWPLMEQTLFAEFRELKPGVWLPFEIAVIHFSHARAPRNMWNKASSVQQIRVVNAAVNEDVPDQLFALDFPSGTRVSDFVNERHYRVGDTEADLLDLISMADSQLPDETQWGWMRWTMTIVTVTSLLLFCIGGFRKWRTPKGKSF